jgi:hypothetical protein
VFALSTATIASGCLAERTQFQAYPVYTLAVVGEWLGGHCAFAGSVVDGLCVLAVIGRWVGTVPAGSEPAGHPEMCQGRSACCRCACQSELRSTSHALDNVILLLLPVCALRSSHTPHRSSLGVGVRRVAVTSQR